MFFTVFRVSDYSISIQKAISALSFPACGSFSWAAIIPFLLLQMISVYIGFVEHYEESSHKRRRT
jgi:hypothetical protein